MSSDQVRVSRRDSLRAVAGLGASALAGSTTTAAGSKANLIQIENSKPGTRDWMLSSTRIEPTSKYRCPWIEGYASRLSVRAGEKIGFHVSTNPASKFTIDLYRLGYYGGDGGRFVQTLGPFEGRVQADPEIGPKRLRNCQWPPCAEFTIPKDWLSGVYLGKLTAEADGCQSYVIFVVRDDRNADYLVQCSDFTWHAYNRWPSQFSLYDDGVNPWYWGGNVDVSFNRPYGKYCQIFDAPLSTGSGEFLLWEFPLTYWMESLGYDVSYISNFDTHSDPRGLLRAKGLLSVGHDEYWTIDMFENVSAAIVEGVNVAFLSGNAVCGRVLYHEATRSIERIGVFGPAGGTREFLAMSTLRHGRPYANQLIGAHSTGPVTGGADWICTAPDHWLYKDTGMQRGDSVPGLIGWEWHGDPAKRDNLEIVASGPTQSAPGKPNGGTYTGTVYYGPSGNFIFNAATCWWADGLSAPPGYVRPKVYTEPKGPDRRVQQMTANVLARMTASQPSIK